MRDPEQAQQLRRVRSRLADSIRAFVLARPMGGQWHSSDLARFVGGNPASVDRILRDLAHAARERARAGRSESGDFNYVVVSRSRSLYERVPLPPREVWLHEQRSLPCMEARA